MTDQPPRPFNVVDFNKNGSEEIAAKVRAAAQAAMARAQGAPVQQDPLTIPTETYLLDALMQHAQAVVNQIAHRGRIERAKELAALMGHVVAFRNVLDNELRQLIVLPR